MSIQPLPTTPESSNGLEPECLPDYDRIITEDDKPVDSMYAERQHRFLTDTLAASYSGPGEGRTFYAATDVGVFFAADKPPLVPDVFVSLDVLPPPAELALREKKHRSYFVWIFGKFPDAVIEVVSNREGGELTDKLKAYARIGIAYYIVWDPDQYLGEKTLHCFLLEGKKYLACDPWFPELELGVTAWQGNYDKMSGTWLRWCDQQGNVLLTGIERAELAEGRADTEKQRADTEKQRVAKLAEKLRSLGIDPDQI